MTAKTLALISGKGGSGKTTLGLSLASLLSSCNIKVLLVDCDLSTNGATYFYEKKLSEGKENLCCFSDILYDENCNKYNNKFNFLKINSYYDFIPSIISVDNKPAKSNSINASVIKTFFQNISTKYEIIIFDCQAGYSDVLRNILPIVELNLAVMEADAISSSAMRSLYLKIGKFLNDKKIFQVFNKATSEEYEIYSKLYGGTIFTNIETIMFDWKIRKAFSVAQIPDMENTSANYGMQLLNICNVLFPETTVQNKLKKFSTVLEIHKHSEEISKLREKIYEIDKEQDTQKKKTFRKVYFSVIPIMVLIMFVVYAMVFFKESVFNDFTDTFMIISLVVTSTLTMLVSLFNVSDWRKEQKNHYTELWSYRRSLEEHLTAQEDLENKLKSLKRKRKSQQRNSDI